MRTGRTSWIAVAAVLGWSCSGDPAVVQGCDPADGVTPICGFQNPEDLVLLPGGSWLAVSQFAVDAESAGSVVAYRVTDGARRMLYPDTEGFDLGAHEPVPGWGSGDCPGPPDPASFAPHGIDLGKAPSQSMPLGGGTALAVVNHGGREAIEFFEVAYAAGGPALAWRGCVVLPRQTWPNDVAFHADSSIVVTNMMPSSSGIDSVVAGIRMIFGADTGSVLAWDSERGWSAVEDSRGSGPNGIAVSPDGKEIFFSEWGASRLVRLRPAGEPRRLSVDLPHHPDNLSWTRDGRLLVTGQVGGLGDAFGCGGLDAGTCALPFSILVAEPATLETEVLIEHAAGAMGAASAAIHVGDELFMGTFAGDRLARASYTTGSGAPSASP